MRPGDYDPAAEAAADFLGLVYGQYLAGDVTERSELP